MEDLVAELYDPTPQQIDEVTEQWAEVSFNDPWQRGVLIERIGNRWVFQLSEDVPQGWAYESGTNE